MIVEILLLLLGLSLVVFGAEILVDGASSLARKAGISEFVIGLTIVGMGTSAPEMVVSFLGALQGNADIAIGNVIGSNIFNTLLILGVTAMILPMAVTEENRRKDIPVNIVITLLLILLGMSGTIFGIGDNKLSRIDGGILVACFIVYMVQAFIQGRKNPDSEPADGEVIRPVWLALLMIVGGLAGLIFGGRFFVNSATAIAQMLGVSDKFIAITILAGGTSLPELVTCIVAAAKKKGQLALGNILGSNIFNILLILGGSALITPLSMTDVSWVDLGVLMLSAIIIWGATITGEKNKIDRADGFAFLCIEAAYMAWLFIKL